MELRTLDLFCGGGGSSWGAKNAGGDMVCAVDSWGLAAETFRDTFPTANVVEQELKPRTNRRILGDTGPFDLIIASPECTNHTCARGSRERCEKSRATARHVLNFARAFQPRWIVIENVIQMRSWAGYADLLKELRRNYRVTEQILDAADFGVPQNRRRLFLICDREEEPRDLTRVTRAEPGAVRDILDPAGTWKRGALFTDRRAEGTLERARRGIEALGEGVPFLVVYYGSDGAGGWQPLDRPIRTLTTLDRFGLVEWDTGEPTLRMLQVPELKKAMGFDPEYQLRFGSRRERIKLLGNGVCPPVMEGIVNSLCFRDRDELPMMQAAE